MSFGRGLGIYMGGFSYTAENTRMLLNLLLYAGGEALDGLYLTDNPCTECAYYPAAGQLVIINNTDRPQTTTVKTEQGSRTVTLEAFGQDM